MRIQWAAVGLVAFILLAAGASLTGTIAADSPNRAGLVVSFPDHTETSWIEFSEDEITGAELLQRSGLDVTFSGFGGLGLGVCAIEDIGCFNPGDCFCQCKSGTCKFWAYFRLDNGEWVQSALGASSRKLKDGDVDGWSWGPGTPPAESLTPIPCPTPTAAPVTAPPTNAPTFPTTTRPSDGTQPPATSGSDATAQASSDMPKASLDSSPPSTNTAPVQGASRSPATQSANPSSVVSRIDESDSSDQDQAGASGSGGAPVGLIAFGAVAAAMLAATGAVIARKRTRG